MYFSYISIHIKVSRIILRGNQALFSACSCILRVKVITERRAPVKAIDSGVFSRISKVLDTCPLLRYKQTQKCGRQMLGTIPTFRL